MIGIFHLVIEVLNRIFFACNVIKSPYSQVNNVVLNSGVLSTVIIIHMHLSEGFL